MEPNQSFLGRASKTIATEAMWQAFATYGLPPVLAVATAILGYMEHKPVADALVSGAVMFAAMSGGLLWFSQWRYQQTAESKLVFTNATVNRGRDVEPRPASIGFALKNNAIFPIEVYVEELRTSLGGRINPARIWGASRLFTVDAGGTQTFGDASINVDGLSGTPSGTLEFKISYGRAGNRRYQLEKKINVFVPIDPTQPMSWGITA